MGMLKTSDMSGKVIRVLDLLHKTYHNSCKSKRELRELADHLGVQVKNPTRATGTRWTLHLERAVAILLKGDQPHHSWPVYNTTAPQSAPCCKQQECRHSGQISVCVKTDGEILFGALLPFSVGRAVLHIQAECEPAGRQCDTAFCN